MYLAKKEMSVHVRYRCWASELTCAVLVYFMALRIRDIRKENAHNMFEISVDFYKYVVTKFVTMNDTLFPKLVYEYTRTIRRKVS